jgi:hypothetical protein
MGTTYTVERLPAEKIDQAYPLILAIEPRLELDQWRRLCRWTDDKRIIAGKDWTVLVATAPSGHFHGLCMVETLQEPVDGPTIAVSKLMIDSVLDPAGVASALLGALADYAARAGCARLRISIRGTDEMALVAMARARSARAPSSLIIEIS